MSIDNSTRFPLPTRLPIPPRPDLDEMEIRSNAQPDRVDTTDPTIDVDPTSKKTEDKKDELTKKGTKRDWITLVVSTSAVALGVIALIAACFLVASIITGGLTLWGIVIPLSIAIVGFTACPLILSQLKKISGVVDDAITKLQGVFKKKPDSSDKSEVSTK